MGIPANIFGQNAAWSVIHRLPKIHPEAELVSFELPTGNTREKRPAEGVFRRR